MYLLNGYIEDPFYINSIVYTNIIYLRNTALYLNGLSNMQLDVYEATVAYNNSLPKIPNFIIHQTRSKNFTLGLDYVETPYGNKVKCYDKERCICDLFISSDLVRTRETSNILNEKLKMDIVFEKGFREVNNGDLRNLTKLEAKEKYPDLLFIDFKMDECYPNGDSPNSFYERVKEVFLNLLNNNKNRKILLVSHGGVITVILSLIYGFPYSNHLKINGPTGSIIKLTKTK